MRRRVTDERESLRVLSLGAGVQTTYLLLALSTAELQELGPPPTLAIFADTGWEPQLVYEHLDWLETVSAIPIRRVSSGNIREDWLANGTAGRSRYAAAPLHLRNPTGEKGMLPRQCSYEYKIRPIYRHLQSIRAKRQVEMWIGISIDEVVRMKEARVGYVRNRWPLIELRRTRYDCARWIWEHHGRTIPKSSCVGCPLHNNEQWRWLRDHAPAQWQDAITVDAAIRHLPRIRGETYLHASLQPLAEVDLSTRQERGQLTLPGMLQECDGVCGV